MSSWQHLEYVQIILVPVFLFSTTFYPLSVYPAGLRWLVEVFPLYHGVEIMRTLAVGAPTWTTLAHASYFARPLTSSMPGLLPVTSPLVPCL